MYNLEFLTAAQADLSRLDPAVAQRVMNRLLWLAENGEMINHYALTGQHTGKFRLRIGAYRALYWLDHANRRLVVESIGHRSEIY